MDSMISIIIPVYNAEKYLPDCLNSVLNQTYKNLEVILVDDGSKDKSGFICEEYAKRDSRIRVIHQDNRGVAAARNVGIEAFSGDYVMFVDSDDTIPPDAARIMLDRIVADESDLVVAKHEVISPTGKVEAEDSHTSWMTDTVLPLEKILEFPGEDKRFFHVLWAKMYRRHVLKGIRIPNLRVGEDAAIYPKYMAKCKLISISKNVVYQYWNRENSITKAPSIETKMDSLKGNLCILRFYIDTGHLISAKKWFECLMIDAAKNPQKKSVRMVIQQTLSENEIKMLLKGQTLKVRVKWISLYIPIIYRIVRGIKDFLGLR